MQGDPSLIRRLNKVLSSKLTAINQYFLHARMYKNWGLEKLNQHVYAKSILDMKQADAVIERILFLNGLPNLQHLERLRIGEHTVEMLQCDLDLEMEQIALLRDVISECENNSDFVSRHLLLDILKHEEKQVDWIETQQNLITEIGIKLYLQSAMEKA
ncbi:MAG: bacterioferritin [Gammaproteobacteria bacterium]